MSRRTMRRNETRTKGVLVMRITRLMAGLVTAGAVFVSLTSCDMMFFLLGEDQLNLNHPPGTYTQEIYVEPKDNDADYFLSFEPDTSFDQFQHWWESVRIAKDTTLRAYKIDRTGRRSRIFELRYRINDTEALDVPNATLYRGWSTPYGHDVFWHAAQDNILAFDEVEYTVFSSATANLATYEEALLNGVQVTPWARVKVFDWEGEILGVWCPATSPGRWRVIQVFARDQSDNVVPYQQRWFRSNPIISLYIGSAGGDSVALNNLDNTLLGLQVPGVVSAGISVRTAALGDLDDDDYDDLVVSTSDNTTVYALSNGYGLFRPAVPFHYEPVVDVVVADMNRDGTSDVIAVGEGSDIRYWEWRSGSLIGPTEITGTSEATRVATGDVTGDGIGDLIAVFPTTGQIRVYMFDGEEFTEIAASPISLTMAARVATGDLNRDGVADFVATSADVDTRSIVVYGRGDSALDVTTPGGDWTTFGHREGIAIAPVTGDEFPDVIMEGAGSAPAEVIIWHNNGDETYSCFTSLPVSGPGRAQMIVAADFTGEGLPDLAIAQENGVLEVFRNHDWEAGQFEHWETGGGGITALAAGRIR
jgi:hypothetical protein